MFGNNVKLDLQFLQLLILLINGIHYSKQAFVYNLIIRMCRNELRCINICTYIYTNTNQQSYQSTLLKTVQQVAGK